MKKTFVKASDRIKAGIEVALRDGTLLPGDAIDEAQLASEYGVSRTPIREALIQLQAEGLVSSLPQGGMVVARMDLHQLLSLWELLAELEAVAVRLACQRMTPQERDAIVALHEKTLAVVEANDLTAWQQANLDFHELIYRGTRNPFLRQEVLRIRTRTGFYRRHAFGAVGKIRTSYEQHGAMVEALRNKDAAMASQIMLNHMRPASDAKGFQDFILNIPKEVLAP